MENVTDPRTDELQQQPTVEQPTQTPLNEAGAEVNETTSSVAETQAAPTQSEPTPNEAAIDEAKPISEMKEVETVAAEASSQEPQNLSDAQEATMPEAEEEKKDGEQVPAKSFDIPDTKEGILERVSEIARSGDAGSRSEQEQLKQAFYKLQREQRAKEQAAFVENGGKAEDFEPTQDALEEELKAQFLLIKELRAKQIQDVEKLKEANLEKKKAIIEKIKEISTSPEEANKAYDTFRALQAEWKEIKPIPESAANEVWKQFQFCQDQFYDLLKTNSALRDYDFKKNLEAKSVLCEAAEKLVDDPDIISAAHQLQQLHQQFREIGPVAKELREDLWNRFKTASSAINKRHAQYFDGLKEKEEENLAKKTAICEEIEAIATDKLSGYSQWDGVTKQILALQDEWKTIGRATKKMNTKIFERFRSACDNFFNAKAEFFKDQKRTYADNAARKIALVEKAEALKDSTDWSAVTNELVKLQKEWKEIGATAHKTSKALWERFNTACNEFFDKKKAVFGDQHKEENENLIKKKTVIDKLEALAIEGGNNMAEAVKALQDEWNSIGHVPYKNKDKIYAKYRDILDKLNKEFNLRIFNRQGKAPRKDGGRQQPEGNNLVRLYEQKKAELSTYENNISFLTANSKKGSSLIDNMRKKIESLKISLAELVEEINNPKGPECDKTQEQNVVESNEDVVAKVDGKADDSSQDAAAGQVAQETSEAEKQETLENVTAPEAAVEQTQVEEAPAQSDQDAPKADVEPVDASEDSSMADQAPADADKDPA